jgi:hypothetical protein
MIRDPRREAQRRTIYERRMIMRRNRYRYGCAVGLLLLAALWPHSALATTHTVLPDGSGDFPTIQAAVDAASDGDVIQLGDGTFTGVGNRNISYLGKAITIQSISDDSSLCIIDCQGGGRGFVFESSEGASSVLEGVTITSGYAEYGGGVYCIGSSPTFDNVVLSENTAARDGGGAYCKNDADVTMTDIVFVHNHAESGGGMYCRLSSPSVTGATFSGNYAEHGGGGMWLSTNGSPTLAESTFSENHADYGGGMTCSGSPTITNVVFLQNYADWGEGGGLECSFGSPTLANVTFSHNQADGGGGMKYFGGGSPSITNVLFLHNRAISGPGGGMKCSGDGSPFLYNVTFWENEASLEGGGLRFFGGGTPTVANATFGYNTAGSGGGGIDCFNTALTLEHAIVAFSSSGAGVHCCPSSSAALSCCDVFGNAGGDWVGCIADQDSLNGNFHEDPLLCGPRNPEEPYTLCADSPCVSHGECGLIGAWPVGCEGPCPVRPTSWGCVKSMFR